MSGHETATTASEVAPITRDESRFGVDQTNKSCIFPGVGLGALAVGASRVRIERLTPWPLLPTPSDPRRDAEAHAQGFAGFARWRIASREGLSNKTNSHCHTLI